MHYRKRIVELHQAEQAGYDILQTDPFQGCLYVKHQISVPYADLVEYGVAFPLLVPGYWSKSDLDQFDGLNLSTFIADEKLLSNFQSFIVQNVSVVPKFGLNKCPGILRSSYWRTKLPTVNGTLLTHNTLPSFLASDNSSSVYDQLFTAGNKPATRRVSTTPNNLNCLTVDFVSYTGLSIPFTEILTKGCLYFQLVNPPDSYNYQPDPLHPDKWQGLGKQNIAFDVTYKILHRKPLNLNVQDSLSVRKWH